MNPEVVFWRRRLRSLRRSSSLRHRGERLWVDDDMGSEGDTMVETSPRQQDNIPTASSVTSAGDTDGAVGQPNARAGQAGVSAGAHRARGRVLLHRPVDRASEVPSLVTHDLFVAFELARQRMWESFLNPHLRPAGNSKGFDLTCLLIAAILFARGSNLGGIAVLVFAALVRGSHEQRFP